ncbi:monocarboxylate transporter 13-like [Ptychodera flava]|uniref:monocarboxylate transporter 13-like n=1 Tax=Ptychodera flava TaxID=63121 RepID=UPI00396A5954
MGKEELTFCGFTIAICSFVVQLMTLGFILSMNVFYIEYIDYFKDSATKTSLINGIGIGTTFLIGPFVGVLVNKFGIRPVVIGGGLLSSGGIIISTFASRVEIMYISFGLITGSGTGLAYGPSVVIISRYFHKYHTVINGIASAGSSIGIMVFPPLYQVLIDKYRWKGAMLIIAAMNMHTVVCGCLMRAPDDRLQDMAPYEQPTSVSSPECDASSDDFEASKFIDTGEVHVTNPEKASEVKILDKNMASSDESMGKKSSVHRHKRFSNFLRGSGIKLFRSHPFLLVMWFTNFIVAIGYMAALVYLVAKVVSVGVTRLQASFLFTIIGVCSLAGKIIHGSMVDCGKFPPLLMFSSHLFFAGMSLLLVPIGDSFPVFAVLFVVFGYSVGVYFSVIPICLREGLGVQNLATSLGWVFLAIGLGDILGPPIAGWLFDISSNYNYCFIMVGTLDILAAVTVLLYYGFDTYRTSRHAS